MHIAWIYLNINSKRCGGYLISVEEKCGSFGDYLETIGLEECSRNICPSNGQPLSSECLTWLRY